MMDPKDRVYRAIYNYSKKNNRQPTKRKKKNASPEKDLVKLLLQVGSQLGMRLDVVESKATFSQKTGRYTGSAMKSGIPDIIGNDADGLSVWIEAKAPGKVNTLRDNQRDFLIGKIESNCFAVVVDCPDKLREFYKVFKKIGQGPKAMAYLKGLLPIKKVSPQKNQTQVHSDLPF